AGRERPRLVATEYVNAAEVLNRRKMPDNYLLAGHAECPLGECDSCDHRQKLRRETNSERNRKQQRLKRVSPYAQIHYQNEQDEKDHRLQNEHSKSACAAFELGLLRACGEAFNDIAE